MAEETFEIYADGQQEPDDGAWNLVESLYFGVVVITAPTAPTAVGTAPAAATAVDTAPAAATALTLTLSSTSGSGGTSGNDSGATADITTRHSAHTA